MQYEKYDIDHITPLAGGGDNDMENLQPLFYVRIAILKNHKTNKCLEFIKI